MFSRCCMGSRKISLHLLSKNVQSRSFHVMNSSKLAVNISKNSIVNRETIKYRTILFIDSARSFSVTSITNATNVPTALPPVAELAASATTTSNLSTIASIPDVPVAPVATVTEQVSAALEPTFASIGLGGWSPVGILQNALELLHIDCGLPWWGAIAVTTLVMRLAVSPLIIISQRNAAKMQEVLPQMQEIQLKMTEARQMGNASETARWSQELVQLMAKEKVNPLKNMLVPLAQAPIFLSYFIGLRRMVNAPVESMQTGGMLWFTDLTVVDPYYMLPLITCATLMATIQLGVDGMNVNMANGHIVKYALRSMPVILFPFIMNFPTALVVYWSTSNFISLIQAGILKIPAVRIYFKIPLLKKHDPNKLPIKNKPFIAGVKDSWSNMKLTKELEGRKRLDEINFQRAGTGPLVKTYKYDPTKPRPSRVEKKVL